MSFLYAKTPKIIPITKMAIDKYKNVMIEKDNIDMIAIGNGTASRESEKFCSEKCAVQGNQSIRCFFLR